jgi:hypothetical protein
MGENQHRQKETVVHWGGLFRKIAQLLQQRWQQKWIIILKALFPQKLSDMSFTNPTSTVGLQLLNLRLLKVMLSCVNDGATTIKPGRQTTGNARVIWSRESSFALFPTLGRVYVWRTLEEAHNTECLIPTVKHGGGSVMVWAAMPWYSATPIITLHGRITAREYVDRLGNQVHPTIQTLFPNNDAVF